MDISATPSSSNVDTSNPVGVDGLVRAMNEQRVEGADALKLINSGIPPMMQGSGEQVDFYA